MEIIYLMIPLAILLATGIVAAFIWAVRSGQFDDLEGPANRILFDDDDLPPPSRADNAEGESKKGPS